MTCAMKLPIVCAASSCFCLVAWVYVWLAIGVNPLYVDTGIRIESAADLCGRCLDDVATDVLYMTGNDHALEAADPLELAEIKRRWEPYINQLPDYAYLCKDLLNGKM